MNSRTPLFLFAIALPFTGCTCEWHASTSKSWSTNSGGERVVVVQGDPTEEQRERDARIAREREWERERERERARHPVVINQGGRTSTGASPHAPSTGQPSVQPVPTPLNPGSFGGAAAGASGTVPATPAAPIAQPSAPVVPATPTPAPSEPAPPPPPPPPASDTYVAPREIDKPTGGPAKAANSTDTSNSEKKKPATPRTGRMTRQQ